MAAALVAAGTFGGYGIGRAVEAVREAWPDPGPQLLADKAVPPEPLDVSGPAGTCTAQEVDLTLTAGATSVREGEPLVFTVGVENVGRVPCLFDGGAASLAVTITDASGEDRVWSSADCASGTQELMLGPGDAAPPREVRWSSVRTVPGCEGGQPPVTPGTYQAKVTMADVPGAESDVVTFTVAAPASASPTPSPEPSAAEPSAEPSAAPTAEDAEKDRGKPDDAEDRPRGGENNGKKP
ncbi:hypothetical protein [Isoptericola variabilis]|uniref:Uncharacterized protein n=1 Tax=Isoptericola variabilis (strain 225) TaxID=743718 RepID=F6FUS4_ISOV2|nr:hypothetical protein [Isoptericola variabilis]AEG43335.1 hypothetical protein Isova_0540 [Isoptericola variabilis 225]TWH35272.1 hypothetical protein L600_000100002760 [Isoptericola variabilis J7]